MKLFWVSQSHLCLKSPSQKLVMAKSFPPCAAIQELGDLHTITDPWTTIAYSIQKSHHLFLYICL